MLLLRRKQVVVLALVAMIAIAGYLNWAYTDYQAGEQDAQQVAQTANLGEAKLVNGEPVSQDGEVTTAKAPDTDEEIDPDFFTQARLEKEMGRSKSIETLSTIINDASAQAESKTAAEQEVISIAQRNETEVTMESLIRAKGYSDAVVYYNGQNVNVIVKSEGLSKEDVAKIQDIVTQQTGCAADKIKIVEVK